MATLATAHGHGILNNSASTTRSIRKARGPITRFVHDFIEDILQKPLQAAHLAKHDMFREHILAMSISYFALIVLLILASIPVMVYFMQ